MWSQTRVKQEQEAHRTSIPSNVASLHHQNSFCWLPTLKAGPRTGTEEVGGRSTRKLSSLSKPKHPGRPGTGDKGGLSPSSCATSVCTLKETQCSHLPAAQHSLDSLCNTAASALPLAQLCKASSEAMKYKEV